MKTTRLLSLLIAFVMLFSSVPLIAIADGEPEYAEPYDYVVHYPDRAEPYVELYGEYVEGATYQWYKGEVILDGETEPELKTELEFASEYICFITLSDATKLYVDFDTNPTVISQPDKYFPVFEVTDSDRVESYQWYTHRITDTAITDENSSNKCSTCESEKYSSYDKDENLWTGAFVSKIEGIYEFFCFEVELKAGDRLLVDVGPEVQEIRITDSDYDITTSPSYSMVGNIGVYDVEVDETYTVSIFTTSEDSKVSAYIRTTEKDVILENETEAELSETTFGGYYYCVATYDNGDTLESNVVAFIPEVYEEPDAKYYEFHVSYEELAKFQWYQVITNEDESEEIITLEGENEYALQNYERNGVYYCEASYPLCMVLRSDLVVAVPVILEQPSAISKEILVTFEDEAKFSWYEVELETSFVDDEMADPAYSGEIGATYDESTGEWTGVSCVSYEEEDYVEYIIDVLYVELKAGKTIRISVSDLSKITPDGVWIIGRYGYCPEFADDGYVYFTAEEDYQYNIYFYATEADVTITVETVEFEYILIQGETEKKLSVFEKDNYYAAKASYDDGQIVLVSDIFKMIPKIVKQPTSDAPSVEVNVEEDGMKYQWYEAIPEISDVTDKDVYLTNEEKPAVYNSETKEWTPTIYNEYEMEDGAIIYELDLFIMSLKAGEQVHFVPSEELESGEIIAIPQEYYGDDIYIEPNEDGTYTFTSPIEQEYYFYTYDDNAEVTFKVTKTSYSIGDAVEGQDKAELLDASAGTYICVITYNDETELISDVVSISIAGDIDSDGDVDAFDYILVKRVVLKTYELTEEQFAIADIDSDGDVDAFDYILVKRIVLGTYKA